MENKPDSELKQLAKDILAGRVFTDRHCNSPEEALMAFMILSFLNAEQLEKFRADPPGMIYEYFDKAGARSVNGLPTFFSMQLISPDDAEKVTTYYEKMKAALESVTLDEKPLTP